MGGGVEKPRDHAINHASEACHGIRRRVLEHGVTIRAHHVCNTADYLVFV